MKLSSAERIGTGNAKTRLVLMSVAALAIGGTMLYLLTRMQTPVEEPGEAVGEQSEEVYALPEVLPGTFDDVRDEAPEDRRYVEDAQLEVVRTVVRTTTALAIAASGARALDATAAAEIAAAPAAARGAWYTVRGELLEFARKPSALDASREELVGSLRTAEGTTVFFRAQRTDDEGLAPGDWARVDGMFFKLLNDELPGPTGQVAVDGPLLVAPEVLQSFPDFGTVSTVEREHWEAVRDDTLSRTVGPHDAMRWRLLAFMRDLPTEGASKVAGLTAGGPLNERVLVDMLNSGTAFRGQYFALPPCRVQALTVRTAGENPARLEKYTEVWLGNAMWQKQPVVRVLLPGSMEHLAPGTIVSAEVVYFMNVAYDTVRDRKLAPMFVARTLDLFEPPEDTAIRAMIYGFAGLLGVLAIVLAVLVKRDERRSKELAEQLVKRRRERRAAAGARS
jgi:hypothetical protein